MNKKFSDKESSLILFNKFKAFFLEKIISEIIENQNLPVVIENLIILPLFNATLIISKQGKMSNRNILWFKQGKKIFWSFTDDDSISFKFEFKDDRFNSTELSILDDVLSEYSDIMSHSDFIKKISENLINTNPEIIRPDSPSLNISKKEIEKYFSIHAYGINFTDYINTEILKCLASLVVLKSANYDVIAYALEHNYGDEDLINLENRKLKKMISSLQNFDDNENNLDSDTLTAVITCWLQIRDNFDDSVSDFFA